ncbi:hypothetical protein [Kaarinaea lacus]
MSSCVEYIAYSAVGEKEVTVAFAGQFESRPVVWNAIIRCLSADDSEQRQQYINVQVKDSSCPDVTIGLPLPTINEPDILKSIMMVRQYRNLRRGRHEFLGRQKSTE